MDEPIYVLKEGQKKGPFDGRAVRSMVDNAILSANDLAWHEGLSGWRPLVDILGRTEPQVSGASPPQPTSVALPADSPASVGVDYWGKLLTAFVLPFIGLCLVPYGWLVRIIGLLLVFLGSYNAVLCLAGTKARPLRMILGVLAVTANLFYVLIAVVMIVSPGTGVGQQSHQWSGESATLAAWDSLNATLQIASSNLPDLEKLDRMSASLGQIHLDGVDPELALHTREFHRLIAQIQGATTRMLADVQQVRHLTQAGGIALGTLFGAAAGERTSDPNDSLRAGILGGLFANEVGNAAMRDVEARYFQEFAQLYDELGLWGQERTRLRTRLSRRYNTVLE